MVSIKEATTDFLAHKRIAVTGVSRKPQGHGSQFQGILSSLIMTFIRVRRQRLMCILK